MDLARRLGRRPDSAGQRRGEAVGAIDPDGVRPGAQRRPQSGSIGAYHPSWRVRAVPVGRSGADTVRHRTHPSWARR